MMQRLMGSRQVLSAALAALALIATTAPTRAAISTWDAGGDGVTWTDADNWSNGVPADSDYGTDAYIGAFGTPGTITGLNQSVRSINLTTAGWTLQGDVDAFKDLSSSGAGTNTITGHLNELRTAATFDIAAGNTLVIGDYLRQYDEDATLRGGGTLQVDDLRSSDFGTPDVFLEDITLRVEGSRPYSVSNHQGEIHIMSADAVLELKTSDVAAVEALFGQDKGGIFDDLDGTSKLQAVYNATTGYTEVSLVVPEPASLALMGLGGVLCLWRRQRA